MNCHNIIKLLRTKTRNMDTIHHLKQLLYERTEELKIRDETIALLEKELDEKDAQIRHLRNEIDKFRQVVRNDSSMYPKMNQIPYLCCLMLSINTVYFNRIFLFNFLLIIIFLWICFCSYIFRNIEDFRFVYSV